MRASTVTKLSLYEWGKILGLHPLHLAQVTFTTAAHPTTPFCDQAYLQHAWQDADRIGREDIARAIGEAEELVERYLKFRLAPSWEIDEWRPTASTPLPELVRLGYYDVRGYNQVVRANWGHFISGGIQALILMDDASPITYSDVDGDGYDEKATVTATVTAGINPCEVAIFYPGKSGDPAWEIRPIAVSISGTTATITFRREQCVTEALMESLWPEAVDGTVDGNFLTTVDVYRLYNDPQTQGTLMWEPTGTCDCGSTTCPSCAYSVQTACLHLRSDPKLSLVAYTPANWNSTDLDFDSAPLTLSRQPDIIRLFYYSGLRDKRKTCTRDMDEQWKRTIAHYAAALLDRPPCDCILSEWEYWREDLSLLQGSDGSGNQKGIYQISQADLDNPFGTRRGMLDAWRRVKREAISEYALA